MRPEEEKHLAELVSLYAKTKRFILLSEQLDPESKSNIAVFKEQRDALDHLMRAFEEALPPCNFSKPDGYFILQIDKARGHLFRAAYDALDGLVVSAKLRINDAMEGVSAAAIHAVFPQYYAHLIEIGRVDLAIVERRNAKDIGDNALSNLESYHLAVERLWKVVNECLSHLPALLEWEKRNRNHPAEGGKRTKRKRKAKRVK